MSKYKPPTDETRAYHRAWEAAHPDTRYGYDLPRLYGITMLEYTQLVEQQGGVCALCGRLPSGRQKRLSVDHDHLTGKIRGLLCRSCNYYLGAIEKIGLNEIALYLAH